MSPELEERCQEALEFTYDVRNITLEPGDFIQKLLRLLRPEDANVEKFDDERAQRFLERIYCNTCLSAALEGWDIFPSHRGSKACRGSALAVGGSTAHCTCDACF